MILSCIALSHQSGEGPAMSFQPLPSKVSKYLFWSQQPLLIEFMTTHFEGVQIWTNKLDEFLDEYKTRDSINNVNCDGQFGKVSSKDVCNVDLRSFGPCTKENFYGYHRGTPCVFLTLEKKRNWTPETYNNSNELPNDMPANLKDYVRMQQTFSNKTNYIWTQCEGVTKEDTDNMGPVQYYPVKGFSGNFFPYKGQDGYLSPLVAVQFERPLPGVVINIRCKAWAKNIVHDTENRIGTVRLELKVN